MASGREGPSRRPSRPPTEWLVVLAVFFYFAVPVMIAFHFGDHRLLHRRGFIFPEDVAAAIAVCALTVLVLRVQRRRHERRT